MSWQLLPVRKLSEICIHFSDTNPTLKLSEICIQISDSAGCTLLRSDPPRAKNVEDLR